MAQRRYYDEDLSGEREPLGSRNHYETPLYQENLLPNRSPPRRPLHDLQPYSQQTTSRPRARAVGVHPESAFESRRAQRRLSRDEPNNPATRFGLTDRQQYDPISPVSPRPDDDWDNRQTHSTRRLPPPPSNVTPGADNFGEGAAGGMAGIAYSVAEQNARESGMAAMNAPKNVHRPQGQWPQRPDSMVPPQRLNDGSTFREPRLPYMDQHSVPGSSSTLDRSRLAPRSPSSSTPSSRAPSRSPYGSEVYTDDPYQYYSRPQDPQLGVVDPNSIEDDGDDGLAYGKKPQRNSMISLGSSRRNGTPVQAGGVAAGAAAGSGVKYAAVHHTDHTYLPSPEKAPAFNGNHRQRGKKTRLAIIIGVIILIVAAIVLGVIFGVVLKNRGGEDRQSAGGQSAASDTAQNGLLDSDSPEIKELLNNPNLHKVFPGMDYTGVNTIYPECLENPPSQNNVTRDLAVLSQLTDTIRLYGTDCNQTEMTIEALKRLKLQDTVKVWLGVWQDGNKTTNARQLDQMWKILDHYGTAPFKGLIVANEILFRKEMNVTELGALLQKTRDKLQEKSMSLPVATSDLGDNWTPALANVSDYIMANIHPFFGGVNAKDASAWTYNFWSTTNGQVWKSDPSKNIISETGWPSEGGTDCGREGVTDCPDASVAGVDQLNQFMDDWVCQALSNGTQYFWFEAFDEPWKIRYNSGSQNWEDHWGLMDVNRNLKKGIKIPDCGGKTI